MPAGQPRRKFSKIAGQFSVRLIEMLESPAYGVLSLSAHRILARLEIEHTSHGGNDNGRLPLTYNQLVEYGLHRHAISAAIREVVALGFVEVTEQGRAGNAEHRAPNRFRLTYRHTAAGPPTEDWRAIKTLEQAETLARMARKGFSAHRRSQAPKENSQCRFAPVTSAGNHH